MEQDLNGFSGNFSSNGQMILLDYIFGEGENTDCYQLVRFFSGEEWNVLIGGRLVSRMVCIDGLWRQEYGGLLESAEVLEIGEFIAQQHFNLIPSKIELHWQEYVEEVVMQSETSYLVVGKPGIAFERFQAMFTGYIAELVEDPWEIEFKVYNADFSDDFIKRVYWGGKKNTVKQNDWLDPVFYGHGSI